MSRTCAVAGMPGALTGAVTINRLRLPPELRRSLACTNAIENMQARSAA